MPQSTGKASGTRAIDERILKEGRESRPRDCPAFHALQLRAASPITAVDAGDAGKGDRSLVVDRGNRGIASAAEVQHQTEKAENRLN